MLDRRALGGGGLAVSSIGLGCASMSEYYGASSDRESTRALRRALELGVTLLDTSDSYGWGANELLIGRALAGRLGGVSVATKLGFVRGRDGTASLSGRPEHVPRACELSLARLGVETIELYQLHRVDPATPIEETVGAMAELVALGHVRHLGLCEVSGEQIRRAAATAPIATVQCEYSLLEREVEADVLPTCEALGIGFVAYAPLCRGLLTGRFREGADFGLGDWRASGYFPRFVGDNLERNLRLVAEVEAVGTEVGASATQVALAWLLGRRPAVVPIPGARRAPHVEANVAAAALELPADAVARLDALGSAAGERYDQSRRPRSSALRPSDTAS